MKIGIITNDETQLFQREVVSGIRGYTASRGYETVVANTGDAESGLDAVSLNLDELAGVLVIANALNTRAVHTLYDRRKPMSLVSHQVPDSPIPAVLPDNAGGIKQLVDYLILLRGRRRIAFIQGDLSQIDGIERWHTFQRELMRHHLPLDETLILRGDFIRDRAARSTEDLLASGVPLDAIAAADYVMAIAAMEVLAAHGRRVPEDVAVAGYGDGPGAAEARLTTVGVDVERIGVHAAKQVIGQIEGMAIQGITLLATNIIQRESS
jgi:LacI family transcriptional regulator